MSYTDLNMKVRRYKLCAFVLILAMLPGVAEILESAVHLATEGHLAHSAPDGDRHEPTGPEHGCTAIFHYCGCHASLAFLGPPFPPATVLGSSLFDGALLPAAQPPGFWPAIDRPPRV